MSITLKSNLLKDVKYRNILNKSIAYTKKKLIRERLTIIPNLNEAQKKFVIEQFENFESLENTFKNGGVLSKEKINGIDTFIIYGYNKKIRIAFICCTGPMIASPNEKVILKRINTKLFKKF